MNVLTLAEVEVDLLPPAAGLARRVAKPRRDQNGGIGEAQWIAVEAQRKVAPAKEDSIDASKMLFDLPNGPAAHRAEEVCQDDLRVVGLSRDGSRTHVKLFEVITHNPIDVEGHRSLDRLTKR